MAASRIEAGPEQVEGHLACRRPQCRPVVHRCERMQVHDAVDAFRQGGTRKFLSNVSARESVPDGLDLCRHG